MDVKDLENRFTYHPPREGQTAKYTSIRGMALTFALALNNLCPDSREKSLAITALESVVYNANAAIARNE